MLLLTYACELAAVALVATLSALAGSAAARRSPRAGTGLAALGVFAFCTLPLAGYLLPAIYSVPQPLAILPALIQALGFLLIGVAARLAWDRPRGRVLISVLGVLAAWFVLREPISRMVVGQRYAALSGGRGEGHVMQGTPQTCAAACAATILRHHGVPASEGEMTVRCRTSFFGTTNFGLLRGVRAAARDRGVELVGEVQIRVTVEELTRVSLPAILTVKVRGLGHAIVLLGRDPTGRLLIGDPLKRPVQRLTPEGFRRAYEFRGDVVTFDRK